MTSERNADAARRPPAEFGHLLRGHRRAAGLTQEALAERAALSVRGLQHLEAGDASPSRGTLDVLLATLGTLGLSAEEQARLVAAVRPAPRPPGRRGAPKPNGPNAPPVAWAASAPLLQPLTSFIGRERELVVLHRLLRTGRLLTLTGPGGCGKTRLALRLAADAAGDYAAGSCSVELAPVRDPSLVPRAVATACGVREEADRPLLTTLVAVLRAQHLLLVLDNCEHLLDACARLADALLRTCPALTVLATSREPLGVAGETPWRVAPLAVPPPFGPPLPAEVLVGYEAVRLLVARAVAVQPAFAVTAWNASAVAQLCRQLDGLPLALELAAARLRVLTVEQVRDRLDDRFRLLTGGSRTALPHQQTLRATVEWSHALLSEPERRLFARLAVFAGGWTLEAAEAVADGAVGVLDVLTRLVDKSLVVAETPSDGAARYHLLETLRQYALERLEADGEATVARERHAAYYVALAERAEPELIAAAQVAWLDRLETELDNFRAVLGWEGARGAGGGPAARLTAALGLFWYLRGYFAEGHTRVRAALTLPVASGPTALRAELLGEAVGYWFQGDDGLARASLEESVAIFRERGSARRLATMLHRLGQVVHRLGDVSAATGHYEEALALARAAGDDFIVAFALVGLGNVALEQGGRSTARGHYEEALALRRGLGHTWGVAHALNSLADLARAEGDYAHAAALAQECLVLRHAIGDRGNLVLTLGELAGVNAALRQPARAARLFGAAEVLREGMGVRLASPTDRADVDRLVALARTALGAPGFAAAWAAGQRMTLEEAVTYALEPAAPDERGSWGRQREGGTTTPRGRGSAPGAPARTSR